MNERRIKPIISVALFIGGLFGMIGSFVPSASLRGLAWGLDGVALILATALLTVFYFRRGYDVLAAAFLVFAVGEGLILSCNAANLNENVSTFGAGVGLWAASLVLVSFQNVFPVFVRLTGFIAGVLFTIVSTQIFTGHLVHALTRPLPFFAYPFFAATIFGWAWTLLRPNYLPTSNLKLKNA